MAKGKGAKKGGGPRAPAARVTPQQLYEQAQLALQYNDYDSARTALRKASKMDPKNVEYLDALGALLAEIGPEDEAIEVLKKSVSLSPDVGYEKYLYLGQLLEEPAQALAATRNGVQVLQAQHAAAQAASSPAVVGLSKALSGALCSLSEMLLGAAQLQQEQQQQQQGQGAEAGPGGSVPAAVAEEVEHFLALASAADPSSPEPGQALASLRYEQGRTAEALEILRRSMALWHTPSTKDDDDEGVDGEEGTAGSGRQQQAANEDADMEDAEEGGSGSDDDDEEEDSDDEDEEDDGPSYEFRLECAKLLLELDETTTTAIDVLESLIEEDDRVPDAWHLLALSYYSGHQYSEAAAVLTKAQALLATLGVEPGDEISEVFADLESAIKEAMALEQQQQEQKGQQG